MTETISLDVDLRCSVEQAWHALTDPGTLARWMLFTAEDFRPVVGQKFRLRGKPDTGWTGVVDGEVLGADEPERLSYTWVGGPEGMVIHTQVTWTLTGFPGGVRLHLEQSGFKPEAKPAIGGARYGWAHMLETLTTLLAAPASPAASGPLRS